MPKRKSSVSREIRAIHRSFQQLAKSFARLAPLLGEGAMGMATAQEPTVRGRRKRRLTAAHRARLKLQGRYMGTLRGLKPGQRARVKKIRAAKGFTAAIAAAKRMAG